MKPGIISMKAPIILQHLDEQRWHKLEKILEAPEVEGKNIFLITQFKSESPKKESIHL